MDDWYKNAIFYGIDIKTFYDSNHDGIGDIVGITQKLDYLATLGITCIWLLPMHPSGDRDNGYDVTDYYAIDPNFGTLEEFRTLIKEAEKRHIKVIMDLVVHHTSNLHPWFLKGRKNRQSPYRDYYVWSKTIPKEDYPESKPAFPGIEAGVWRHDGVADAFYFHRFYYFEPDLNLANPKVQEEIFNIVEFWLSFGIAGFRVDAATMLFERKGIKGTEVVNGEGFMEGLHSFIKKKNPQAILLAEADVTAEKVTMFFNQGRRMHLLYNFLLNRFLFLAFARGDGRPIRQELESLPVPPFNCQWVNFLRNLDELNIQHLKPFEQKEVYKAFGSEENEKIYHRGIRRRLAPMFGGDTRRLKMAYSLIFSLPGAALLVYGEEIGMGDNLELPERESVRIPMHWDGGQNGGFSSVDPKGLIREVLSDGPFRYEKVNVVVEQRDKASLYHHIQTLCAIKQQHPEIGTGEYKMLDTEPGNIFAISYNLPGKSLIALHNLSAQPTKVKLTEQEHAHLQDFFNDGKYEKELSASSVQLNGYGYRWFYVKDDA